MPPLPEFLEQAPNGVDQAVWETANDGERLRWAKVNELALDLTREQYLELAAVPFWAVYGPEHGLPYEIFNEQGFLLPKYRPGGERYEGFKAWRRWYRHRNWRLRSIDRRLARIDDGHAMFVYMMCCLIAIVLEHVLEPHLPYYWTRLPELIRVPATGLGAVAGVWVALLLARGLIRWWSARWALRRFPPPPTPGE